MAFVTSGPDLTVVVLDEAEAKALASLLRDSQSHASARSLQELALAFNIEVV